VLFRSRLVIRGGSWINLAKHCRAAYRSWTQADRRYTFLGLRLACAPSGK
jgi:formylglycine-generating enzyme required for sulfatase activity